MSLASIVIAPLAPNASPFTVNALTFDSRVETAFSRVATSLFKSLTNFVILAYIEPSDDAVSEVAPTALCNASIAGDKILSIAVALATIRVS